MLAAGRSTRFDGDKLTAVLGEHAVVRWSVAAIASLASPVLVVVPPDAAAVCEALRDFDVRFVENVRRNDGMASSIAAGVLALAGGATAVVIALGDQPLVRASVVEALCERWRKGRCAAVVPEYTDGRGHPVLFGRECFAALAALTGDAGARSVLDSLGDRVAVVPVDTTMPLDVDTWAALERVRGMLAGSS